MKIYTKKGDKGETSLIGGKRVSKANPRIDAYGTVDELNAFVGVVRDNIEEEELRTQLLQVQNTLFNIGSLLAVDPNAQKPNYLPEISKEDTSTLEMWIDILDKDLQPLKNFILPGGHLSISYAHVVRCICRRAERRVVELEGDNLMIIQYLNRLSDYFFTLSRKMASILNVSEIKWAR